VALLDGVQVPCRADQADSHRVPDGLDPGQLRRRLQADPALVRPAELARRGGRDRRGHHGHRLPASYALARFKSRLRNVTIGWILVSQVFPFILIVIPVFIVLRNLGLINTLVGLVLVYVVWALPFTLWMLQGYVAAIPRDLEEAASTDGASRLVILTAIIFPLLLPGLVATSMFAFISAWNEFFFALVIIQDPALQTAPLLLARYVGAEGSVNLGPLAATALVTTLPSLVVFGIIQRKLVSGMLSGSVKG
jgi:multiple sugar transport system permease protein